MVEKWWMIVCHVELEDWNGHSSILKWIYTRSDSTSMKCVCETVILCSLYQNKCIYKYEITTVAIERKKCINQNRTTIISGILSP